MKHRTLFRALVASTLALLAVPTQASAHEGALGDGGPFRIEITTPLPSEVEARWGNGELELHVPTGMEIIALGVDGEPFAKVDAEGNMFGNEKSPTWWLSMGDKVPAEADSKASPEWAWVRGGGSMQYHDHRIHFMAASLDPSLEDGSSVFDFALPFIIDGTEVVAKGSLVFDSTLDPSAAAALKSPDSANPESNSGTLIVVAVAVIATLLAGAAVIARSRK